MLMVKVSDLIKTSWHWVGMLVGGKPAVVVLTAPPSAAQKRGEVIRVLASCGESARLGQRETPPARFT
jgi:hypothetical protein